MASHTEEIEKFAWSDLPVEIAPIIIDKMDTKTRCKFGQTSNLSQYLAKDSMNYIYGLKIHECRETYKKQLIFYFDEKKDSWVPGDYWLEFLKVEGDENLTVLCYKTKEEESKEILKWSEIVEGKPEDVRMKYIRETLEKYPKIRYLRIFDTNISLNDFNIKNLKKLETLDFADHFPPIDSETFENFIGFEKILKYKYLRVAGITLSFEKIMEFTGDRIHVKSPDFDLENIKKYLKMIKNEEIWRDCTQISRIHNHEEGFLEPTSIFEGLDGFGYQEDYESSCRFNFASKSGRKFHVEFDPSFLEIALAREGYYNSRSEN